MKPFNFDWRIISAVLHDVCAVLIAWVFAFAIRFNFSIPPEHLNSMWLSLLWILPLQMCFFMGFDLYKGIWRFASTLDLTRIIWVVLLGALVVPALLFMFNTPYVVPRTVLVLYPIFLISIMGGSRFAYRIFKEHSIYGSQIKQGEPVIIMGAGAAAIALVKELSRSKHWRVVALLDDNKAKHKREILGVKVMGKLADLEQIYQAYDVKQVIIAMPSASHQKRRTALDLANKLGLEALTVPAIGELISGKVNISHIRKVDVEDLLGRDVVELDTTGLMHLIENESVLVSGAGGSIGSELCRQILKYNPAVLVCFDISEYAIYNLEQELSLFKSGIKLIYLTGDVKNSNRIKKILGQHQPSIVFHAAAYKHVPLMENGNVWEALSNNAVGTYTIAQACKDFNVAKFVLISTDKAVNPTNVMGASKRLGEMICQGLQEKALIGSKGTRFIVVRFGNVLGSSGSVIPKFKEQIAYGGPITITHPEITRYFMSIPEASQLVMQAGLMGLGGEIFVLDMGEPVKIVSLASDMIRLSGLQLDDIKIEYVGLRPGEKLYEELLADDEHTMPTPHDKLRIALARPVDEAWVLKLLEWIRLSEGASETTIKNELKFWVNEYVPQQPLNIEQFKEVKLQQNSLH